MFSGPLDQFRPIVELEKLDCEYLTLVFCTTLNHNYDRTESKQRLDYDTKNEVQASAVCLDDWPYRPTVEA